VQICVTQYPWEGSTEGTRLIEGENTSTDDPVTSKLITESNLEHADPRPPSGLEPPVIRIHVTCPNSTLFPKADHQELDRNNHFYKTLHYLSDDDLVIRMTSSAVQALPFGKGRGTEANIIWKAGEDWLARNNFPPEKGTLLGGKGLMDGTHSTKSGKGDPWAPFKVLSDHCYPDRRFDSPTSQAQLIMPQLGGIDLCRSAV
jgi:hypothetical protein